MTTVETAFYYIADMPYRSIKELPPAFKNFTAEQKRWALRVLNALLRAGYDEGKAIRITIALTKKHFGLKAAPKAKKAANGNK